ncbi:hypothetical protein HOE67_03315 [Candidatus Peregrinibacteria bacterium]|jgi:tellurite resistance protein TehA-like permease|nr:hypothetical protein [Candidatus Peregrinibacteria bacterium]MBT4056115.1 hypothetical protein [Candidatus Peregrinibacteria bacterium]
METIKAFFGYFLESTPGQDFKYYYILLALIVLLIVGSFLFKRIHKNKTNNKDFIFKTMFKKVPPRLIYFAIGLIFLAAVRYENIPYFAMRLWLYLVLLGLAVMLGFYAYKYFKKYPKELENFQNRPKNKPQENNYLPNKKRK